MGVHKISQLPSGPVLITGARGFIGRSLAGRLAQQPNTLVTSDLPVPDDATLNGAEGRVVFVPGDIADDSLQQQLLRHRPSTVFHLAGIVSGAAQADFDLGRRINLQATQLLLENCRQLTQTVGTPVRFVYASSIAVFGVPLPGRFDDDTPADPTLSYGTHKRACELLIDDYSRRGFIDGRALRLPGVVVRPPLANGALSGFNSDLIREPLAGRDYTCPVSEQATIWICSLARVLDNLLTMASLPADLLGARRTVTAPALAVSTGQVRDALAALVPGAGARIRFTDQPDPALQAQFGRWPLDARFARASRLGLRADPDLPTLVRDYLTEQHGHR